MKMFSFAKTRFGLLLLSSTISVVLFVGIFEIVENIRYYSWKANFDNFGWFDKITVPSTNHVLMWEYRPYGKFEQIETNRFGYRDLDYESMIKPEDTFRIAFAGDSITLGLSVDWEDTFVRQFETEANKKEFRQNIQALNFSVDGYNAPQVCEMIKTKVIDFSPDIVVYTMCLNDFDFCASSGLKIRYFRKPKSFFLSKVKSAYRRMFGGDFHLYHFRKNKDVVFQNILDIKEVLERKGSRFRVVILPVFPENATDFDNYPLRGVHKEIGLFLLKNGIRSLDLLDAFSHLEKPLRDYCYDIWHPNVFGHRLIAKQLVSFLLSD